MLGQQIRTERPASRARGGGLTGACQGRIGVVVGFGWAGPQLVGPTHIPSWSFAGRASLVALMVVGGVMARHAALAFLPGLWFLFVEHSERRWRATVAWAVVSAITCSSWWWARETLGQQNAFPWFSGRQQILDILGAMAKGVDRRLGVYPLGIAWFIGFSLILALPRARRLAGRWLQVRVEVLEQSATTGFVWVSLAALVAMFLLVDVSDPAGRRFVSFAGLIAAVITAGVLRQAGNKCRYFVFALVLLPPLVPVVRDVVAGRVGDNNVTEIGGESFVPLDSVPGPAGTARTRDEEGRLRVPVPVFLWQRRALQRRGSEPR